MQTLNNVKSFTETVIAREAAEVSAPRVSHVLGLIRKAIAGRRNYEAANRPGGVMSNDFRFVEKLDSREVALFMLITGVNPAPYINGADLSDAEFERIAGIDSEARTRNLKGYAKLRGVAEYFLSGGHAQAVLKTVVACSIVAHKFHDVLPRNTCQMFIDGLNRNAALSQELKDAIAETEASGVLKTTLAGGGAPTQFSQCSLQLATMRAATIHRNGRYKDFALDLDSPVIQSFAQRFGMVKELESAVAARDARQAA